MKYYIQLSNTSFFLTVGVIGDDSENSAESTRDGVGFEVIGDLLGKLVCISVGLWVIGACTISLKTVSSQASIQVSKSRVDKYLLQGMLMDCSGSKRKAAESRGNRIQVKVSGRCTNCIYLVALYMLTSFDRIPLGSCLGKVG